jgi:hypothetical protein
VQKRGKSSREKGIGYKGLQEKRKISGDKVSSKILLEQKERLFFFWGKEEQNFLAIGRKHPIRTPRSYREENLSLSHIRTLYKHT